MENHSDWHLDNNETEKQLSTLVGLVSQLKENQQLCNRMFCIELYGYDEISAPAGRNPDVINRNIQNGKRQLRLWLDGKKKSHHE